MAIDFGLPKQKETISDVEDENEISTIQSVLAGIGSGLFKIPEGFVSLGATLMDLGADTNKAAEVEEYFAKINPFDEMAEATTAGKITELIINIGIPGGVAFKAGNALAKSASIASKNGKYVNVTGQAGKNISKGIKKKIKASDPELTGYGKTVAFGSGSLAGGVAEGIFVDDVEEAGTFGDLIGGPTELDRGLEGTDYNARQELFNRLKFGAEGALFTGLLGGAGATIKKLRNSTDAGKAVNGKLNRWLDKWISQPLRARGKESQEQFLVGRKLKGNLASDTNTAETIVRELDSSISKLFPFFKRAVGDKTIDKERKELLKELNQVLLSSEKNANALVPIYKDVGGRRALNAAGKTLLRKTNNQRRKLNLEKISEQDFIEKIPAKDRQKFTEMVDRQIESISFGNVNKKLKENFTKKLKDLGADQKDIDSIFDNLSAMRIGWGQLFTSMGRRLDANGAKEFRDLFGKKVTTWLDSTYDVFKDRKSKLGEMYAPSKQVMDAAKESFKKLYRKNVGQELSDAAAQQEVLKVYNSANIEKGFRLNSASDPYFKLPNFFLFKSTADEAFDMVPSRMSELTGMKKEAIEQLYGKGDDALQTILNGTGKLSAIVRRNEYFDNLLNTSNELRASGKTPIFANNADEAQRLFGGVEGVDWKAITPVKKTKAGVKGIEPLDPNLDYKQTLQPLKGERKPTFRKKDAVKGEISEELPIHNPLQTKYALVGNVDSLVKPADELANSSGFLGQIYQNLILYPKATSQMAKTILSPFTHARNFISAGAFAAANGIIPFADPQAVKKALDALQVKGFRKDNEYYRKLLRLGVVNSQVQLGDLENLLRDVKFGGTVGRLTEGDNLASYGLNRLLKVTSKIKKFSEDAYTAEDDFWKIFSFIGETKRLRNAYKTAGIKLGDSFTDIRGNKVRLTDDYLEEQAADIVKNNIPNYAYVSEFVKGLRKAPIGNFVSFPAEILRTSTNIVQRGLDEIFHTVELPNGTIIRPLKNVGLQRLGGMAFTTAAVPYAAVSLASAIYDVTEEERAALRRYVADWSKNSTLIPIRDKETGKLKYIDFSHTNAYDTISRPIQTILNRVNAGEQDKDGMMDDFILGVVESTKELGLPFVSESIWTQALNDIFIRRGRTPEGFKVWDPEDQLGTKFSKALGHLTLSQAPFNFKQLQRLGLSMKPINDLGRFDDRGRQFDFGDEALGVIGFRAIEANPDKSFKYKLAEYERGARNSKNLFKSVALRGGAVTAKDLVDAYINSNRALFENQRDLYLDLNAANTLKGDMRKIGKFASGKIGRKNYGAILNERFIPYIPSKNVFQKSEEIARDLREADPNYVNPMRAVVGVLANIRMQLFNVGLEDEFPVIDNPFKDPIIPAAIEQIRQLPPMVTGANPAVVNANQKFGNIPFTQLTETQKEEKGRQVFGQNDNIFG